MRQRDIVFRHVYIIVNIQRNLFTRSGLVLRVDNNKPKAERNSSRIGHSVVRISDKKTLWKSPMEDVSFVLVKVFWVTIKIKLIQVSIWF